MVGAGCLADGQILPGQSVGFGRVAAGREPKLCRMIGKGRRVTRQQFIVAGRSPGAPPAGFLNLTGLAQ
jgi:hypothetical protein